MFWGIYVKKMSLEKLEGKNSLHVKNYEKVCDYKSF